MTREIRLLCESDHAAWMPLWTGYLAFYRTWPAEISPTTWDRLMDPAEPMHALGLFDGGDLAAIAHYIFHRHTWTTADLCFLVDVFTSEGARGAGIGTALVEAVFDRARAAGASCVYGMTDVGNTRARGIYDRVAQDMEQAVYRKVL